MLQARGLAEVGSRILLIQGSHTGQEGTNDSIEISTLGAPPMQNDKPAAETRRSGRKTARLMKNGMA